MNQQFRGLCDYIEFCDRHESSGIMVDTEHLRQWKREREAADRLAEAVEEKQTAHFEWCTAVARKDEVEIAGAERFLHDANERLEQALTAYRAARGEEGE